MPVKLAKASRRCERESIAEQGGWRAKTCLYSAPHSQGTGKAQLGCSTGLVFHSRLCSTAIRCMIRHFIFSKSGALAFIFSYKGISTVCGSYIFSKKLIDICRSGCEHCSCHLILVDFCRDLILLTSAEDTASSIYHRKWTGRKGHFYFNTNAAAAGNIFYKLSM